MDITFSCIHCGQSISVDEAGAGMTVNCPRCANSIAIPSQHSQPSTPETHVGTENNPQRPTVKKCPYCAEEILAEARKCKHCGEMLDSAFRSAKTAPLAQPRQGEPSNIAMLEIQNQMKSTVVAVLLAVFVPFFGLLYSSIRAMFACAVLWLLGSILVLSGNSAALLFGCLICAGTWVTSIGIAVVSVGSYNENLLRKTKEQLSKKTAPNSSYKVKFFKKGK